LLLVKQGIELIELIKRHNRYTELESVERDSTLNIIV